MLFTKDRKRYQLSVARWGRGSSQYVLHLIRTRLGGRDRGWRTYSKSVQIYFDCAQFKVIVPDVLTSCVRTALCLYLRHNCNGHKYRWMFHALLDCEPLNCSQQLLCTHICHIEILSRCVCWFCECQHHALSWKTFHIRHTCIEVPGAWLGHAFLIVLWI